MWELREQVYQYVLWSPTLVWKLSLKRLQVEKGLCVQDHSVYGPEDSETADMEHSAAVFGFVFGFSFRRPGPTLPPTGSI